MENAVNYKCPCCGAALRFDGQTQKLVCDSCENAFDTEQLEQFRDGTESSEAENSFSWEEYTGETLDGVVTYTCPSCGGEIVGDKNTAATKCPYCDNAVVLNKQLSGTLKPDCILPFVLSKKDAVAALANFCKGKKLLPDDFTRDNHLEEVKGIYVPFWLFDCDGSASISFNAERLHFWSDRDYNYTRTEYFKIFREGSMGFDGIPVDGSSRIDDALMDSIEPFDYSKAEDFGTAFMPGFFADKYDVNAAASLQRANERVTNSIVEALSETVQGYNSVVPCAKSISVSNGRTRYALMPLWLLNTKYKGEIFTFAVNGQSGKISGNLPVDKGKYWRRFFAAAAITAIPLAAIALLIGGII